jgi:hypothetical protein
LKVAKRLKLSEADFPAPGSVFVAPTGDGRRAAGRVLRRQFEGGAFGVLVFASRWIGEAIPPLDSSELREPLVLTHHSWQGRREIFWTHDPMPAEFQIIGRIPLSNDDLAETSNCYAGWQSVPLQALTQWRWDHERETLLCEEAETAAAESERRRKAAVARAEFMRTLTLDSLGEKTWLESWDADESTFRKRESQQVLTQLVNELRSQSRLTKPAVRRLLKQSVEAFNRLDAARQFISTIEREDLCGAFEQIACASGFPQLADEIDNWRHW